MNKILETVKSHMLLNSNPKGEYAALNEDAIYINEEKEDIRTAYYKDIDRIIHSLSYTKYIDKTQVYSLNKNTLITKRIVHVMLVSKVARTIGRALELNEDLIEAIALGHDIGHVPFGHIGEAILNKISLKHNLGYFNHNIHSVRTFLYLDKRNLTLQTLDGIMCHNGELPLDTYYPQDKTVDDFFKEFNDSYHDKGVIKKMRPMSLEGCVMRISDIIAYLGRDIEDAIILGKLNREALPKKVVEVLGDNNSSIINTIILDLINNSYHKPYLKLSKEVYEAIISLKKYNYEFIYDKANTKEQILEYENMYNYLFDTLVDELENNKESVIYKDFINKMDSEYIENNNKYQKVLDYIASMTDSYFIDIYNSTLTKN